MTYDEYISETTENCKLVLSDCHYNELEDIEYLRKILWEDDRVTGVIDGRCSSIKGNAAENIKGALFDQRFLADFNGCGLNMQKVMAYGSEAIDVVIRCLALKHISIIELAEQERESRVDKSIENRRNSSVRV